jgi:hypothetical protein
MTVGCQRLSELEGQALVRANRDDVFDPATIARDGDSRNGRLGDVARGAGDVPKPRGRIAFSHQALGLLQQ